jgi:hypothetical protein
MTTFGKPPFPPEKKTAADFEYIYNPDGTCAARYDCGKPGVVLAYDEFSPECATWFCSEHWEELGIATPMFVIVEDKRPKAIEPRYEAHPFSPGRYGVYDHVAKDFVKNPQTNRNRLYHSMPKAETEAVKLNKAIESPGEA